MLNIAEHFRKTPGNLKYFQNVKFNMMILISLYLLNTFVTLCNASIVNCIAIHLGKPCHNSVQSQCTHWSCSWSSLSVASVGGISWTQKYTGSPVTRNLS